MTLVVTLATLCPHVSFHFLGPPRLSGGAKGITYCVFLQKMAPSTPLTPPPVTQTRPSGPEDGVHHVLRHRLGWGMAPIVTFQGQRWPKDGANHLLLRQRRRQMAPTTPYAAVSVSQRDRSGFNQGLRGPPGATNSL